MLRCLQDIKEFLSMMKINKRFKKPNCKCIKVKWNNNAMRKIQINKCVKINK